MDTYLGNSSDEALDQIAKGFAEMVRRVAYALVLDRTVTLVSRIAKASGVPDGSQFVATQGGGHACLILGNGMPVEVSREREQGSTVVDIDRALSADSALAEAFQDALVASGALEAAEEILTPLFEPGALMLRSQFIGIARWLPLIEHGAYKAATETSIVVDGMRSHILRHLGVGGHSGLSEAYWWSVHKLAHLTLAASAPEARPWLSEMAIQFEWKRWTPTYWLLRERTAWLAAVAARSAIAFGPAVVDRYLGMLSATREPMLAFDALFGLTAIGLSDPIAAAQISREIKRSKDVHLSRVVGHLGYFELAYDNAVQALDQRDQTHRQGRGIVLDLNWRVGSAQGMGTSAALVADPTRLSHSGKFAGFAMLPFIAQSDIADLYPAGPSRQKASHVSLKKLEAVFRRAWLLDESPPTLH